MDEKKPPDCRTCGLCCVSPYSQDCFCDLDEEDAEKIGASWVRRNVIEFSPFEQFLNVLNQRQPLPLGAIKTRRKLMKAGPLKGRQVCTCVALRGSVLHQVSCSIYERRPRTCREAMVAGNAVCQSLRQSYQEDYSG